MKLSNNTHPRHAGDYHPTSEPTLKNPRWHRVVAGITALSITATGGIITNRLIDPVVRYESYLSETMDDLPGTGGEGTISEEEPAFTTVTSLIMAPAQKLTKKVSVSYDNLRIAS